MRFIPSAACALSAVVPCITVAQVPSSSTRLVVTPSVRTVVAGDSLQLRGQLVDAGGQPAANARIMFVSAGGHFEGSVDSTGLVRAGAVGTIPVTAVALISGAKPIVERFEVAMVPGPAARIDVSPRPERLLIGQRTRVGAQVCSAIGDQRADGVHWASTSPAIVKVDANGIVQAVAPGRATILATAGSATARVPVEVVAA